MVVDGWSVVSGQGSKINRAETEREREREREREGERVEHASAR